MGFYGTETDPYVCIAPSLFVFLFLRNVFLFSPPCFYGTETGLRTHTILASIAFWLYSIYL